MLHGFGHEPKKTTVGLEVLGGQGNANCRVIIQCNSGNGSLIFMNNDGSGNYSAEILGTFENNFKVDVCAINVQERGIESNMKLTTGRVGEPKSTIQINPGTCTQE